MNRSQESTLNQREHSVWSLQRVFACVCHESNQRMQGIDSTTCMLWCENETKAQMKYEHLLFLKTLRFTATKKKQWCITAGVYVSETRIRRCLSSPFSAPRRGVNTHSHHRRVKSKAQRRNIPNTAKSFESDLEASFCKVDSTILSSIFALSPLINRKRSRGQTGWAKQWEKGPFLKGAHYFPTAMSRMWNTLTPYLYANRTILEQVVALFKGSLDTLSEWFLPRFLTHPRIAGLSPIRVWIRTQTRCICSLVGPVFMINHLIYSQA